MRLNIKDKLDESGMTRYELAKRVNVTYQTITNIYKGESASIKLEILEAICRELKCTPNDIIVSDDPIVNRLLLREN
jgi:putative transcriptional regulator